MHSALSTCPLNRARHATLACLAAGLMAGCAAPVPPANAPEWAVPADFKHGAPGAASAALVQPDASRAAAHADSWWTAFGDTTLNSLIERSNQGNTGIQTAAARLAYAEAQARHTQSAKSPALNVTAGASRQTGPLRNAAGDEGTLFTVGAGVSYELDVWGRIAQSGSAASQDAQSRAALLDSARLLAQAQVAQTYLQIRALATDIGLLQQIIQGRQESLRIMEHRVQAGSVSALDGERLRDEAQSLNAELLGQQQLRTERENALATLLGEPASAFALPRANYIPQAPAIRPGLPATVLARRPDVAATQHAVEAAQKRLGAAQSAWLPSIALTAAGGYAAPELSTLFSASMQTLVIGALASLPLLDGGKQAATRAMAEAEFRAAAVAHREQALNALREVEDQLSASKTGVQQRALAERAVLAAARRTAITASAVRSGLSSQLDLLNSQMQEWNAQRRAALARASQAQTAVALVRALGGGWD